MPNPLLQAKEALARAIEEKKRGQELISSLGPAVVETLKPILHEIAFNTKLSKQELLEAVSRIKIDVPKADVPQAQVDVRIPDIKVPAPQVTVNVPDLKMPPMPEVKLPKIVVPKPEVTVNVPPIKIPNLEWPKENMPIEGWVQLQGVSLSSPLPVQIRDAEGKPVSFGNFNGSANAAHVVRVSGVLSTVAIVNVNPDGNPVSGTGLTDSELRATAVPVSQVSGANWSVSVTDITAVNLDIRDLDYTTDDVSVYQVSGASWSVEATQAGTWNIGTLTGITNSLEVKQVSGFTDSVFVTGSADSMLAYQARTTNPTAVSDGGDVRPSADDLGRTITRPIQVRDLIVTAYATITDSSEDTLLTGAASTFHDLIYVMGANQSGAAVNVNIRSTTGGPIVATLTIPANSTAGVSLPVPIPQVTVADTWTVQNSGSDISNTTVTISALFSKEV